MLLTILISNELINLEYEFKSWHSVNNISVALTPTIRKFLVTIDIIVNCTTHWQQLYSYNCSLVGQCSGMPQWAVLSKETISCIVVGSIKHTLRAMSACYMYIVNTKSRSTYHTMLYLSHLTCMIY